MIKNRKSLGIDLDAYVVLFVGRPFKRKGFHTLLRAWQLLAVPNDKRILLMTGCSKENISQANFSEVKNVVALNYVDDLRCCYAACDIVVLPSFHEGLPYSLLEGAAAGKPLIASDIPGIETILNDKKNGLLVPVADSKALADAIVSLQNNPRMRKQFGENGLEYVKQNFDRKILEKAITEYYLINGIKNKN